MNSHERMGIIASARNIGGEAFDSEVAYDGPGKFEGNDDRELAVACYYLLNDGWADEEAGSSARIGSVLIHQDDQGFVSLTVCGDEQAAETLFDLVSRV